MQRKVYAEYEIRFCIQVQFAIVSAFKYYLFLDDKQKDFFSRQSPHTYFVSKSIKRFKLSLGWQESYVGDGGGDGGVCDRRILGEK